MLSERNGGLVELIPSPAEKRAALLNDHAFYLLENLHRRMKKVEFMMGIDDGDAEKFDARLARMRRDEADAAAAYKAVEGG